MTRPCPAANDTPVPRRVQLLQMGAAVEANFVKERGVRAIVLGLSQLEKLTLALAVPLPRRRLLLQMRLQRLSLALQGAAPREAEGWRVDWLRANGMHRLTRFLQWVQAAFPDEPFDYDCAIVASSSSGTVDEVDSDSCAARGRDWFKVRYITSLYWAFTTITTVGYGDITAKNNWEKVLSILFMVVGMQVFTNVASQFKSWADNRNAVKLAADRRISLLMGYLKQRQVKFRDFLRHFDDILTLK